MTTDPELTRLAHDGFAVIPSALAPCEVASLLAAVEALPTPSAEEARGGQRDLFRVLPVVRNLASHPGIRSWPAAVLGSAAFAIRAILFDKTPDANWKVAWHQDLTIPARQRMEVPGFGPWSEKAGIPHVQPPPSVLERMLTVRVHLDPCDSANGPVRVLPGSHREGRLSAAAVDEWKAKAIPIETPCPSGGLLLMHPLLLHASSPAERPTHRRVIHLEYAADPLPHGLEWHECWPPSAAAEQSAYS